MSCYLMHFLLNTPYVGQVLTIDLPEILSEGTLVPSKMEPSRSYSHFAFNLQLARYGPAFDFSLCWFRYHGNRSSFGS